MMSVTVTAQAKNVQTADFGDYCCIPECKSAFYTKGLTLNVMEKESKLALAYLSFRKITRKREDE